MARSAIKINEEAYEPISRESCHEEQIVTVQLVDTPELVVRADTDRRDENLPTYEEDGEGWYNFSIELHFNNGDFSIPEGIRYETENFDIDSCGYIDLDDEKRVVEVLQKECIRLYGESLIYGEPLPEASYMADLQFDVYGNSVKVKPEHLGINIEVRNGDDIGGVLVEGCGGRVRAVVWDYEHDEPIANINIS